MAERILKTDIVKLFDGDDLVATLFWGDKVNHLGGKKFRIVQTRRNAKTKDYDLVERDVTSKKEPEFQEKGVLKLRVVDVGQGDGAILESPDGKLVLLDGGEKDEFLRYVHRAFAYRMAEGPMEVDAIVVTHGDADHYSGLTNLLEHKAKKRHLVNAKRVFHNGLTKAASDSDKPFGDTVTVKGQEWAVDLVDDITEVPDERLNSHFLRWKKALVAMKKRMSGLEVRRVEFGDDEAFQFFGVPMKVLGPVTSKIKKRPALPFLTNPEGTPTVGHTINGHSVVLQITHGNVRILFGADLNIASEERLLEHAKKKNIPLKSEILKVPHHGSHEFVPGIFAAIEPVVSIVSSGDQAIGGSDHIHPRAGLVGALGKFSRKSVDRPLVYVTEMVAYFEPVKAYERGGKREIFNAHVKKTFGIVHVRTDGKRVLVATHSGQDKKKESYVFTVSNKGKIAFEEPDII
jgi:beta-lactamase superfamily II metal-dependent hydrolase